MRFRRYGAFSSVIYRAFIDPVLCSLRSKVLHVCLKRHIGSALDIATATGAQCRRLGTAGIETVGLDLSEAMIAAAREHRARNVEYVVGSAYELPFQDASFDAALLTLALHEHTETERASMISEALRIVKHDGYVVLADYSMPAKPLLHLAWQVICLIEYLAGPEHRTGFREFIAYGGITGLLTRYGLEAQEIVHSHFGTIAIAVIHGNRTPESDINDGVA